MTTIGRILTIAWKELLHLRKDRVLIPFFMLGAIGELALLAWATSQPIDDINLTVVDMDQSSQSAELIDVLDDTDTLNHDHTVDNVEAIHDLMDSNDTTVAIVIPERYGQDVVNGNHPTVRLILNGADTVSSLEAERVAQEVIFQQGMRDQFNLEPEDYAADLPQVTVKYNEDLKRGWYTLPAEMGFMFYIMTVAIAALAISRERERGTYEQLLVMPYRAYEVIIGKALTPMLAGFLLFLSMLGLTVFAFGVPFRGSLPLLLILALVYLMSEMGKGVLLSMSSRTQLQAVLLVFVVAMVDMVFSGYAVAVETMPPVIRTLSNIIPIRHWLIIVRGIMLKDVGLDVLLPHIFALVAIGIVIMSFTATQYRRYVS